MHLGSAIPSQFPGIEVQRVCFHEFDSRARFLGGRVPFVSIIISAAIIDNNRPIFYICVVRNLKII